MRKIILLLICAILYMPNEMTGQGSVTLGTDFYVAFGQNSISNTAILKLKVITTTPTEITLHYGDGTSEVISGLKQGTHDITLNYDLLYPKSSDLQGYSNKSLYIKSDKEIALYAVNQTTGSADVTAVLPISSLGSNYEVITYDGLSEESIVAIVATDPGTTNITIDGVPQTLSQGQVAFIHGYDATGMKISADDNKKIAVFSTVAMVTIPNDAGTSDHLYEQMWPVNTWGRSYIVPVTQRTDGSSEDLVRIYAHEDTEVTVTGGVKGETCPCTYTIKAGEYKDIHITEPVLIKANNPIAVNSFMLSNPSMSGIKNGDPSQSWINPLEQGTQHAMVAPFAHTDSRIEKGFHKLIIVVRDEYANKTSLSRTGAKSDKEYIDSKDIKFTSIPGVPGYSIAVVQLDVNETEKWVYEVNNDYGINTYVYGSGDTETYFFAAGSAGWETGPSSFYFYIDDIIYQNTTERTNSYSIEEEIIIDRYVNGKYDSVKWKINGESIDFDANEPNKPDDPDDPEDPHSSIWSFNTPTNPTGHPYLNVGADDDGKNVITMTVYRDGKLEGISVNGLFWIVPPPELANDVGYIFGNVKGGDNYMPESGNKIRLDITNNDKNLRPASDIISIKENGKHGTAVLDKNNWGHLIYTPTDPDFKGIDSIEYCIKTTKEKIPIEKCAYVFVLVTDPIIKEYEACAGANLIIGMQETPGVEFKWQNESFDDISGVEKTNTIMITVGSNDTTFYAIPYFKYGTKVRIGNTSFPILVKIRTEGCGGVPVCGNITLYLEDFGGNNESDVSDFLDTESDRPSSVCLSSYDFQTSEYSPGVYNRYAIAKKFAGKDDHTYPTDVTKGRMLVVRGSSTIVQDTVMRIPVGDLCKGMKYSFSAWISNLEPAESLKPNFTFVLFDKNNKKVKYMFSAQMLQGDNEWRQYGFEYEPDDKLYNLELLIINNPVGSAATSGHGNFYAIDDVKIALCTNAKAVISVDEDIICTKGGATFTGTFTGSSSDLKGSTNSVISFWQYSKDGVNWTIIPKTGNKFIPLSTGSTPNIKYELKEATLDTIGYYRMGVGADNSLNYNATNVTITSPNCIVYSDPEYLYVEPCFKLQPDTVYISKNTTVPIDVLKNDLYPCNTPKLDTLSTTAIGAGKKMVFSGGKITYTPPTDFIGIDIVKYSVECTINDETMKKDTFLYIIVAGPQKQQYDACIGSVLDLVMETTDAIKGVVTYDWYAPDGSLVTPAPTDPNTLTITAPSTSGTIKYYVQPFYEVSGIKKPVGARIPIEISVKDCKYTPCPGTVIFKDDFGGNNVDDDEIGTYENPSVPVGGWSLYVNSDKKVFADTYSLLKSASGIFSEWWSVEDDHTYDNNSDRGYFMLANTNNSSGKVYYDNVIDLGTRCDDTKFSTFSINVWLRKVDKRTDPNVRIIVTDNYGNVYADVQTGSISNKWQQYGVEIPALPKSVGKIRVQLLNAVISTGDVVLAIDDIGVSVCSTVALSLSPPEAKDQCEGSKYTFYSNISYTTGSKLDAIFGEGDWMYRWEYSKTGSLSDSWKILAEDKMASAYTIDNLALTDNDGFYRLIVGSDNIGIPSCRIASEPVELKVLSSPKIEVTGNVLACSDVSTTITAVPVNGYDNYRYDWYDKDGGIIKYNNESYTITDLTSSTKLIVKATGENRCFVEKSVDVEHVKINLEIEPVGPVCKGNVIKFQADPGKTDLDVSFKWYYLKSIGDTVFIGGENWSNKWTVDTIADVSRPYYVAVKNSQNCVETKEINVEVNRLPDVFIYEKNNGTSGEMCEKDTLELKARGAVSYKWSNGVTPYDSIRISPKYSDKPYEYWVIGTDANGCTDTAYHEVMVKDIPIVTISSSENDDAEICAGKEIELTAGASAGASTILDLSKVRYDWDYDPSIISTNDNVVTVKPKETTTYTVTVTNTENGNGCSVRKSIEVKVNVVPEIYPLDKETIICAGEQTVLKAQLIDPEDYKSSKYKWTFNNHAEVKDTANTFNLVTANNGWAVVTVTNMYRCIIKDSSYVRVMPKLVLNITSEGDKDEMCFGDTITLTAHGAETYKWEWLNTGETSNVIKVSPDIPVKYILQGTDSYGCTASDTFEVKKVRPLPEPVIKVTDAGVPSLNHNPIICAGDTIELAASLLNPDPDGNTKYTYRWIGWTREQTPNRDTVRVWPKQDTTYTVVVTSQYGCQAGTSIKVLVNGGVSKVELNSIEPVCEGQPARITAKTVSDYGLEYAWGSETGYTGDTPEIEIANPKNGEKVWVTATNYHGCVVSTDTIIINVALPPAVSIIDPGEVCAGNEVELIALGDPTYTWKWKDTDNTSNTIIVIPEHNSEYIVFGYDGYGCRGSDTIKFTSDKIKPALSAKIEVITPDLITVNGIPEICVGESITLRALAEGGKKDYSYSWSHNSSTDRKITVEPEQDKTFTVYVTDANGCSADASITVKVKKLPVIGLTTDKTNNTVCMGDPVTIKTVNVENATDLTYLWRTGDQTSEIILKPNQPKDTIIWVEVTGNGCTYRSEDMVVEVVLPPVVKIVEPAAICTGKDVTLIAIGADSYVWSTGETGDRIVVKPETGVTYTVTGTDIFGCTATDSYTISTVNSSPVPVITTTNPVIKDTAEVCAGSSIQLTVDLPAGSYEYLWNNNFSTDMIEVTPAEEITSYKVTVKNISTQCEAPDSITVRRKKAPEVEVTKDTTVCPDIPIVITARGLDSYQYIWTDTIKGDTIGNTRMLTRTFAATEKVMLTVTDLNKCATKEEVVVRVLPSFTMTITGKQEICFGEEVILTASPAAFYKWNTGETSREIKVSPNMPATYYVDAKHSYGCVATDTFKIKTVNPLPEPVITAPGVPIVDGKPEICEGTDITLVASDGYSFYSWKNNSHPNAAITVKPDRDSVFTVVVTDSKGCSALDSIKVKVNKAPEVDVPANTTVCPDIPIVITATGSDTYQYIWTDTVAGVVNDTIGKTNILTHTFAANEEVTLTVTDPLKHCVTEKKIAVEVSSFTMTVTGKEEICFGEEVTLTASGATFYKWNTGDETQEIKVRPDMPATYSVEGTNDHGCKATGTFEIKAVNPLPEPVITAPGVPIVDGKPEICEGTSITLEASTGYSSYSWTNNSHPNATITVKPDRDSVFTVVVTGSNGCSAVDSIEVKVNKAPKVDVTHDTTVCPDQPVVITAKGLDEYLYIWTDTIAGVVNDTIGKTNMLTHTFAANEEVTLTVTDLNRCATVEKVAVRVSQPFAVTITGKEEICFGEEVTLTASGATSYKWNTGDDTQEIKVHPDMPETYYVDGFNYYGCMATDTFKITAVNPLPIPSIAAPGYPITDGRPEICEGDSITLVASASGGSGVYSFYRWTNNSHPNASITVKPDRDSVFTAIVTDSKGCSAPASMEVKVNKAPEVYVPAVMTVCPDQPVVIAAQGLDTYKYIWTDTINGVVNDTIGKTNMLTHTFTANEEVTLTVTDLNHCTTVKKVVVKVLPSFEVSITGGKEEICFDEEITLTASGASSYLWNTGETTETIKVHPDMPATYYVRGFNSDVCMATDTFKVTTVHSLPALDITVPDPGVLIIDGAPVICAGDSVILQASASGGSGVYDFYSWTNNSHPNASIKVKPAKDSVFTVIVTDSKGCRAVDSMEVKVTRLPVITVKDDTVCLGSPVTLKAVNVEDAVGLTYLWSTGYEGSELVLTPNQAKDTMVRVEVTGNGCTYKSDDILVKVVSPPVVEIIEPESICAGTDVILRAIGAVRYEWSTGETGDQIVINSDKADVTYIVTGYDNFGCVATDLFTINAIKSSPVPSITTANPVIDGKAEVCAGSSLVLTAEPSGDYDYWWGSAFPTSPSVTVTPEEEETTYTVRVTDQSTKCSASASITVKVNKLPAVYLPFDTVVCPDQPVVIPAKGPDTYQYEWTNASGDFIGETNMLTRTFTAAEELTLTITDYKQCETKKKVMVEILPSFTMTVTGKYETCFGDEVTLTASEATSYLWSTGETTKEIKVRPLAPTTYRVTGANDKGCMATSEFTVTTVHPLPQPVITVPDPGILIIEGKPEICEGQSITLKAAAKDDSNAVYSFCNWENNLYSGASITVTPAGDSRYTVTVTDSKGCSAPASIEVKVNKASEIEHIDDRTVCAGSVVVLAAKVADEPGYLYKWYEWNGNIKTPLTDEGSDARELVLTPVQNKRISVEVYGLDVDNKKKCTAMQEDILINVVHSPVVYVVESNENPDVVCAGATVTLTAYGAATYKWSTTGVNGNYTLEGDHIEVKPEMNSTYWVKGADSHGCTTTASKTVKNIRTLPSPTVSVGSGLPVLGVTTDGKPEICSGSSIELVASVNDPNGTYTYNWTHNSSNSPSVTVAPEDGETGYSVVVADGNGCSATASITVRVISMPELEPLDDMVVCPSQPFIIDAKATGLGLTYLWSTGEKSATIEIIPTSRQNMWVEVSNLRNCKVKDEFTVDVLPSLTPKLKIVGINENCAGGAIQLTASGADNYLWNTGETSAGITVNPTSPTTYIVTGTDGNGGCPVTAEYTVSSVKSLPVPGISGKTDICAGESVTLTASGGNTYRWANHTSFDSTLTVTPEADATYTVTITGDNDCSVDTSITVKVHNYPKVEPLDDMIICPNQSVILRAQSEDIGLTYLWSAGDTASVMEFTPAETQNVWVEVTNYKNCTTKEELLIEVLPSSVLKILSDNNNCSGETVKLFASGGDNYVWSTGETTDTIYVSPDIAITYQVAGTDNYGCPATASYDLKMGTLPVAVVEGKTDICAGESATLTASGGGSYKWANNSALSNSILVTPAHDSTFVVRVTTDAGCYADVSKTVTVHQPPLLEPFTDTIVCPGQRVVLQAKASGMGLTYLWDTGDKTDVIEFVARENTELTVEVFNMKHCSTTEKIAIEVWPLPPVKITGSQAICAGSELTLTASGAESYTWNTGFTGSDYTLKPENGNEYTVTGVDQHGCKATVSTGVIVDKPAATINVNPKYIWENASDVHFETVTGITEYEVLWDFGDGVWSSFPEVDHHYHITGNEPQFNVVFSIVDKNGCSDTIRETVSVDIHPVTVFFPNLNQVFMSNCEVCQNIEIYDRSGIKLYEGSSGWDGTYKGRLLEPDTYFYVITLKFDMGGTNIRKGYITVGKDGRTK